ELDRRNAEAFEIGYCVDEILIGALASFKKIADEQLIDYNLFLRRLNVIVSLPFIWCRSGFQHRDPIEIPFRMQRGGGIRFETRVHRRGDVYIFRVEDLVCV